MTVLTFSNFRDSTLSAAGKTIPPKVKGSDGNEYALSKAAYDVVTANMGSPLEVETTSKTNGKYVNWSVLSARLPATQGARAEIPVPIPPLAPAVPPSIPNVVQQGAATPTPPSPGWRNKDDDVQRLIVRQSCLKAASELVAAHPRDPSIDTVEVVTYLAEKFMAWVYDKPAAVDSPKSQAAQHLEDVRQKAHDKRADYSPEDAVCPACGQREYLKQFAGGWFCAKSKVAGVPGGCGFPPPGERLDMPVTYGEYIQRSQTTSVPWK